MSKDRKHLQILIKHDTLIPTCCCWSCNKHEGSRVHSKSQAHILLHGLHTSYLADTHPAHFCNPCQSVTEVLSSRCLLSWPLNLNCAPHHLQHTHCSTLCVPFSSFIFLHGIHQLLTLQIFQSLIFLIDYVYHQNACSLG